MAALPGLAAVGLQARRSSSREPLGLFGDSADVLRTILETATEHRHVNYQPVVADMARVGLGEALLGDLRLAEAAKAALPACAGTPQAAWVGPRAELVVGRSLELEGERDEAAAHYRRAAQGGDPRAAQRAREALARPASPAEVQATALLARARREREAGRDREAQAYCLQAFSSFPQDDEARLCAARESLRAGRPDAARSLGRAIVDGHGPAWLRPGARLVLAEALEARGEPAGSAALAYRRVWDEPLRARRPARGGGGGDPAPRARLALPDAPAARAVTDRVFKVPY